MLSRQQQLFRACHNPLGNHPLNGPILRSKALLVALIVLGVLGGNFVIIFQ